MRLLLIHEEARMLAGAERMLVYYLDGLRSVPDLEITVAAVPESRFARALPPWVRTLPIPAKIRFSVTELRAQLQPLLAAHRARPFDLAHGWAARDWELTALWRWRAGRPALGTLHDDPEARFHGAARRRLMRWSARWGLDQIACVSEAVREACLAAGYASRTLRVVHNGLPLPDPTAEAGAEINLAARRNSAAESGRFGFLGVFSERKGLRPLLQMMDLLAGRTTRNWTLALAGGAQDEEGQRLLQALQGEYAQRPWWASVEWRGWVEKPDAFLRSLDCLIVPSAEFDPFPTVLLEAGRLGLPVIAARVGGVAEIVRDGETGWLYDPEHPEQAVRWLEQCLAQPAATRAVGQRAAARIREHFSVGKMVAGYRELYSTLTPHD